MLSIFIHHMLMPLIAIAIVLTVYFRWIRPAIRNLPHIKELYDQADTFWQRIGARMRAQWDLIVSGVLLIVPQLPDVLSQIQGVDLSAFVMTETQKAVQSSIAIILIILRAFNLKKTGS